MSKTIVFPTSTLKNKRNLVYDGMRELILQLNNAGDKIIIMSHNRAKVADLLEEFDFIEFCYRWQVRELLKNDNNGTYILVGSNDDDLKIAASTKTALLTPKWSDIQDEKAVKYGIEIPTIKALHKVIQIIKNQKVWFYKVNIDENATVYSLTSANSKGNVPQTEKEIVDGFRNLLKHGNKKYFKVLQLHFLASIIHNPIFKDVDIWSFMPSSGTDINEDIWALKERARILMGKRLTDPLFIRHTKIKKSHSFTNNDDRLYCERHFPSMNINPDYLKKLKGKTVCILDDYLNNGTSFETIRNLLMHAKVKKVIFVSLGKFRRNSGIEYYKQDYRLAGNIFTPEYSFKLQDESNINGVYDTAAQDEIRELYNIIYS
ncbi:phosphoribosyltransferase [Bacillus cereus group sp. MYBK79-1]|uniref:phosphoribosyltransferase n=1 Tax=unclassified Bacillus cereus group TaxID=2750818 RepID=UPI003F7B233C